VEVFQTAAESFLRMKSYRRMIDLRSHHSVVDRIGAIRLLTECLSSARALGTTPEFWLQTPFLLATLCRFLLFESSYFSGPRPRSRAMRVTLPRNALA